MRAYRYIVLTGMLVAGLAVAACGPYVTAQQRVGASRAPAGAAKQEASAERLANEALTSLQSAGLPVGQSYTFSPADDPDHLLGTPGQYVGKVTFQDARLPGSDQGADIGVADGGCIEVFANLKDVANTQRYFDSLNSDGPIFFSEYDYWHGLVLLRISSRLDATQAGAYQSALYALPSLLSLP